MLNRQTLIGMWDLMRQRHGIAVRLISGLPADKLDSHPIPNMRTPKELTVHIYDTVFRGITEGVAHGEVTDTESKEDATVARLKTRDDLVGYMRESWDAATRAVESITDAQLAAEVKTPWGMNMPGGMLLGIVHDEFLHHRGQLYAYSRALGVEPPMLWDFGKNDAAYQPKAQAHA